MKLIKYIFFFLYEIIYKKFNQIYFRKNKEKIFSKIIFKLNK